MIMRSVASRNTNSQRVSLCLVQSPALTPTIAIFTSPVPKSAQARKRCRRVAWERKVRTVSQTRSVLLGVVEVAALVAALAGVAASQVWRAATR